jgi:predicted RecA/RadA family phage recombinase
MIAKYVQKGESIDYTPAADVAAGDVVVIGNIVGVAKLDIPANTLGSLSLTGIYAVVKDTTVIGLGTKVYWNAANKKATTTATNNTSIGLAVSASGSADGEVLLLLMGAQI